jgi:tetratricopeptide (TPR) repeat protein
VGIITRGEEIKGKALSAARTWLKTREGDLNPVERHAIRNAIRSRRSFRAIAVVVLGLIAVFIFREQRKDRREEALARVAVADQLAAQGDWFSAIDSLNAVSGAYPYQDSLFLKRGRANAALDYPSEAIADFTEAHRLNPEMIAPILERADAHADQGSYPLAMADYEEVLRRDPRNAQAFFGRGATRLQLKGSTDSSLADFTASFEADSSRTDALFARGNLNQSLGRDQEAAHDFREVLAHSTDSNIRAGAQARLDSLVKVTGLTPEHRDSSIHVTRTIVFLHYTDRRDSAAVDRVRTEMQRNGAFNVPRAALVPDSLGPSGAELRFREGDDRSAKDAIVIAEAALAKVGFPLRLSPRALSAKRFPGATAGRLEVWLPSFSRSLYSTRQSAIRKN